MYPDAAHYITESVLFSRSKLAMSFGRLIDTDTKHTLNNKTGSIENNGPSIHLTKPHPVRYYGIGSGGCVTVNGIRRPYIPKNTELDLYSPIPFRMVFSVDELAPVERLIYQIGRAHV
jgi:hypothetical protein